MKINKLVLTALLTSVFAHSAQAKELPRHVLCVVEKAATFHIIDIPATLSYSENGDASNDKLLIPTGDISVELREFYATGPLLAIPAQSKVTTKDVVSLKLDGLDMLISTQLYSVKNGDDLIVAFQRVGDKIKDVVCNMSTASQNQLEELAKDRK